MKKLLMGIAVLATAFAIVPAALADSFDFTYTSTSGPAATATGTLTGSLVGGVYDITSGTIDVTSGPITGIGTLIANSNFPSTTTTSEIGTSGYDIIYDDALMPGANPEIDEDGLLFSVSGVLVNLYSTGASAYDAVAGDSSSTSLFTDTGNFSASALAPAPEPSSLLLFGTGLIGAAEVARRKFAAKLA